MIKPKLALWRPRSHLYYKGLCLFGLCLSVSLYLCISVAVSGDSVQIKSWVYSYWFADFVFEDWSYEIIILTFWIQMKCWCMLLRWEMLILNLKFELKKGYCCNFNIIHNQKFGLNVLLIWPWILGFKDFKLWDSLLTSHNMSFAYIWPFLSILCLDML